MYARVCLQSSVELSARAERCSGQAGNIRQHYFGRTLRVTNPDWGTYHMFRQSLWYCVYLCERFSHLNATRKSTYRFSSYVCSPWRSVGPLENPGQGVFSKYSGPTRAGTVSTEPPCEPCALRRDGSMGEGGGTRLDSALLNHRPCEGP